MLMKWYVGRTMRKAIEDDLRVAQDQIAIVDQETIARRLLEVMSGADRAREDGGGQTAAVVHYLKGVAQ